MLEIKELVLRVPGTSEQDGRVLADNVVRRLASDDVRLGTRNRHTSTSELSICVRLDTSSGNLADTIAAAIRKAVA